MFIKKDIPKRVDKDPDELPGLKKKSFVLPFAGGEIWFEHLDGIYQYSELAIEKLHSDAPAFRRPSSPGYITFVLSETAITDELILEIANALIKPGKQFMRAAFAGADTLSSKNLKSCYPITVLQSNFLTVSNRQKSGYLMSKIFNGKSKNATGFPVISVTPCQHTEKRRQ